MRGVFHLSVNIRILVPKSNKVKDKYKKLDKLRFKSIIENNIPKYYVTSTVNPRRPIKITRDELAFVRLIYFWFGGGDFSILMWGKGKSRGKRRFWDGMIKEEKYQFQRRKEAPILKDEKKVSFFERQSSAIDTESYIGRYCRTKRPGVWWNF